jgi:hypothetical protein
MEFCQRRYTEGAIMCSLIVEIIVFVFDILHVSHLPALNNPHILTNMWSSCVV